VQTARRLFLNPIEEISVNENPSSTKSAALPASESGRRGRWWKILAIAAGLIGLQAGIDLVMGGQAEYFNAHATLTQLTKWVHSRTPSEPMIYRQQELGALALPIATLVLFGAPLLVAYVLVRFASRYFAGKYTYTEIEIAAPPEAVWAVLANNTRYPEWNPYHVKVTGDFVPGGKLVVDVHKPNGEDVTVKPRLLRFEPNRELTWGGGIRGLFYGEHVFLLEPAGPNRTRLIHKEAFKGLLVRFVPLEAIDEGYKRMNQALKAYVEGY
jgi:hypothetical protein